MAKGLDADGLEMYEGFFTSLDSAYLGQLHDAIGAAGFEMPCYAARGLHQPIAGCPQTGRRARGAMIRVARVLGGPRTVCRVLTGQRYPEVGGSKASSGWWKPSPPCCPWPRMRDCARPGEPLQGRLLAISGVRPEAGGFSGRARCHPEREYFGVQYDPSNAIVAGDDPVALLERVADRVVSMHASDRYLVPGASLEDLRQSDGTLGYSPSLRHASREGLNDYTHLPHPGATRYAGWISIEDGMNGMEEMAQSLEFLRQMVATHFKG